MPPTENGTYVGSSNGGYGYDLPEAHGGDWSLPCLPECAPSGSSDSSYEQVHGYNLVSELDYVDVHPEASSSSGHVNGNPLVIPDQLTHGSGHYTVLPTNAATTNTSTPMALGTTTGTTEMVTHGHTPGEPSPLVLPTMGAANHGYTLGPLPIMGTANHGYTLGPPTPDAIARAALMWHNWEVSVMPNFPEGDYTALMNYLGGMCWMAYPNPAAWQLEFGTITPCHPFGINVGLGMLRLLQRYTGRGHWNIDPRTCRLMLFCVPQPFSEQNARQPPERDLTRVPRIYPCIVGSTPWIVRDSTTGATIIYYPVSCLAQIIKNARIWSPHLDIA